MDLVDVFGSKAQTRFIQFLLQHPNKAVTQAFVAKMLDVSPSTIARVMEPLRREGIIVVEQVQQMKVIMLNMADEKVKVLSDFYEKLKSLS